MAHSILDKFLEEKSDAMWELPYRGVCRWYTEASGQELGPKTNSYMSELRKESQRPVKS